jgi:hypothetical protein
MTDELTIIVDYKGEDHGRFPTSGRQQIFTFHGKVDHIQHSASNFGENTQIHIKGVDPNDDYVKAPQVKKP